MSFNEINAVENFVALTPWPLSPVERGDSGLVKLFPYALSVDTSPLKIQPTTTISSPFRGRLGGGKFLAAVRLDGGKFLSTMRLDEGERRCL